MANEYIARRGLISLGNTQISGDTTITGNTTVIGNISGTTFYGSGAGLTEIPASGVTGLDLDRITSGSNSAIMSSSGLTVNTGITATSFITSGGTSSQFVRGDGRDCASIDNIKTK